jgi:hypothetical protein
MKLDLLNCDVIDNDDTNAGDNVHLSRIRIRPTPEMNSIDESLLPWARPLFNEGMKDGNFSHSVPEKGSKVWCIFLDAYYKQGYYITGQFIDGFFNWEGVKNVLENKIDAIGSQVYPNPRFTQLPDGSIIFNNTATGEMGILHNSGTYAVINSKGGINIVAVDKIIAKAPEMDITIDAVNEDVKQKVEGYSSHSESTTGLKEETIGGSKKVSIGSSLAETVMDEKSETTVGNRNMTIGGNLKINLPSLTSSVEIDCGLGKIKMDGATGKCTINDNFEVDI